MVSFLQPVFSVFDTALQPILGLGPFASIVIVSVLLALLLTVIYWVLVDKEEFQEVKQKLKDKQQEAQEAQKEGDEERAAELMKESFSHQMDFFRVSAKPMVVTIAFMALFFPWMGSTYAPGAQVMEAGNNMYEGNLSYGTSELPVTVNNQTEEPEVRIEGETYGIGDEFSFKGQDWKIVSFGPGGGFFSQEGVSLKVKAQFISLPGDYPVVGDAINWLLVYFFITVPLSYGMRRAMGLS